jgi:hypothetical protein
MQRAGSKARVRTVTVRTLHLFAQGGLLEGDEASINRLSDFLTLVEEHTAGGNHLDLHCPSVLVLNAVTELFQHLLCTDAFAAPMQWRLCWLDVASRRRCDLWPDKQLETIQADG